MADEEASIDTSAGSNKKRKLGDDVHNDETETNDLDPSKIEWNCQRVSMLEDCLGKPRIQDFLKRHSIKTDKVVKRNLGAEDDQSPVRHRGTRARTVTSRRQSSRQSKMPDQSLGTADDLDNEHDSKRVLVDYEDRILEDDSIEFEGTTYYKNKCYWMIDGESKSRRYGIKHFLRDSNSALCVEIIEFKDTVLETVQDTSEMDELGVDGIEGFIQRAGSANEINLSDIEEEVEEIDTLPSLMYVERQKGSSSLLFAIVDTSKTPVRNGLRQSPIKGVDMFSGAGLFSSGFVAGCNEAIQCKIIASVDKDDDAVQSYANIHNATKMEVSSDEWKLVLLNDGKVAMRGTAEEFFLKCQNHPDFKQALGDDFGLLCPPCQGFSKQNVFKEGNVEQNNRESLRILEAAETIKPKVLVLENVLGLWERKNIQRYLQKIVYGLVNHGYNVQVGKLCAADFGDAQLRPRLILIASSSEIGLPVYPQRTHGRPEGGDVAGKLLRFVSARDMLKPEEDKYPEKDTPIFYDGDPPNPNHPAGSVLASKSAPHYCKNRLYSLNENAILMGQGSDFVSKLVGNNKSKQRQIGNGVPMELGKAIGRAVGEVLKWNWEVAQPKSTIKQEQRHQSSTEGNEDEHEGSDSDESSTGLELEHTTTPPLVDVSEDQSINSSD